MNKRILFTLLVTLIALVGTRVLHAQDGDVPTVEVSDQLSLDGTVWINAVYNDGPGFVVIHTDNGEGRPGPVIGHRWVNTGWNYGIEIEIDARSATPTLFAMLHQDTGEIGMYEFGTVDGADGPVAVDGNVVTPAFNIDLIYSTDQFVSDGTVTIDAVVAQAAGWLVVHRGDAEGFGPVAGATQVAAGLNTDVVVTVEEPTDVLWPMLHVDTGVKGEYEFGTVDGVDDPVALNSEVAVFPIWTVPNIVVFDQIIVHGENTPAMGDTTLVADTVLSAGPGFLVIHADNEGRPGPVLGFTTVSDGLNIDVAVELNSDGLTPVLWPMLHVDTGVEGEYEFGTVDGVDGPVITDDGPLTYPISAAPSFNNQFCEFSEGVVLCDALIDAPGFLVIHDDNEGRPGPVLGYAPLLPGINYAFVEIDTDSEQVWPMLHYDTGTPGEYEFGAVEGADVPVFLNGAPVVGPVSIGMME